MERVANARDGEVEVLGEGEREGSREAVGIGVPETEAVAEEVVMLVTVGAGETLIVALTV